MMPDDMQGPSNFIGWSKNVLPVGTYIVGEEDDELHVASQVLMKAYKETKEKDKTSCLYSILIPPNI